MIEKHTSRHLPSKPRSTLDNAITTTEDLARRFLSDFRFGVTTAAYQIEEAVAEDGRNPSIWESFPHMPGRVHKGHTGDVACYNMGPGEDGAVRDEQRRPYLGDRLTALAGAMDRGIPLKGYLAWSLMDNFEWAEGHKMRFGIVHVDYDTQIRTVKDSGLWYSALAKAHALKG